jgi:hypothetical protein
MLQMEIASLDRFYSFLDKALVVTLLGTVKNYVSLYLVQFSAFEIFYFGKLF